MRRVEGGPDPDPKEKYKLTLPVRVVCALKAQAALRTQASGRNVKWTSLASRILERAAMGEQE